MPPGAEGGLARGWPFGRHVSDGRADATVVPRSATCATATPARNVFVRDVC